MSDVNKVILLGNLTADPEIKDAGENKLAVMRIATSRWRSDTKTKEPTYHRVVVFGKRADTIGEYLKMGSRVYVEGRIEVRQYTDKAGVEKYATDIVVSPYDGCVEFQPGRGKGGAMAENEGAKAAQQAPPADFDDDIPF